MYKHLLLISCAFILAACQQTTVLIYARYLPEADVQNLTNKLEQAEYQVEINEHPFPKGVANTAIIASPFLSDREALGNIEMILAQNQWPVYDVRTLTSENHWFTKETIGVFLLPEGIDPHEGTNVKDLSNNYTSRDCDNDVTLTLNPDGSYVITAQPVEGLDPEVYDGQWSVRTPEYLELLTGAVYPINFYFHLAHNIEQDKVSKIKMISLRPVEPYDIFNQCELVHGTRLQG